MRIDVKLFTAPGKHVETEALIPVFHGLIQRGAVADQLLIDVADYGHVVDGPGVMLLGHQGQYGYDFIKGKPGLLFSMRRAPAEDAFAPSLRYAFAHAAKMAALLEQEASLRGKLEFDAGHVLVRVNDRLRAPNDAATAKALEPELRAVLESALGAGLAIEPAPFGQELLSFSVRAKAPLRASAVVAKV
jgi:hypothetical protein